jgi:hypothetical protein
MLQSVQAIVCYGGNMYKHVKRSSQQCALYIHKQNFTFQIMCLSTFQFQLLRTYQYNHKDRYQILKQWIHTYHYAAYLRKLDHN